MSILSDYERQSATWIKLKEHIEERTAILRKKNDGDLTERETMHVRGQIAALKNLLAQVDQQSVLVTAEYDAE